MGNTSCCPLFYCLIIDTKETIGLYAAELTVSGMMYNLFYTRPVCARKTGIQIETGQCRQQLLLVYRPAMKPSGPAKWNDDAYT